MGARDTGRFRVSARSEKKRDGAVWARRVVSNAADRRRGGGLALDDAPWPKSSAALKPSTSSMVMPESGLARLFVMKSEARERGPRDGGRKWRAPQLRSWKKAPQLRFKTKVQRRAAVRPSAFPAFSRIQISGVASCEFAT